MSAHVVEVEMSSSIYYPPSRSRYMLDIDDIMVFPDFDYVPVLPPEPGESWYVITEIVEDYSVPLVRPIFKVEDKLPGHFWMVTFYTDNSWEDARDCRPGRLICIRNGRPMQFADGTCGYRIDDPSTVIVLPCKMRKLREINEYLRQRYNEGLLLTCVACNLPVAMGCRKCKTRYCSRECQRRDWPTHKPICKILKTLHEWNRTDWG
ncbi:hypothetical protein BDQ17DRAFT_1434421 [Cyathus striatus]|nr:hypothetical protein BDQ17DRAFT_1434421 [Cyathus striatus]